MSNSCRTTPKVATRHSEPETVKPVADRTKTKGLYPTWEGGGEEGAPIRELELTLELTMLRPAGASQY